MKSSASPRRLQRSAFAYNQGSGSRADQTSAFSFALRRTPRSPRRRSNPSIRITAAAGDLRLARRTGRILACAINGNHHSAAGPPERRRTHTAGTCKLALCVGKRAPTTRTAGPWYSVRKTPSRVIAPSPTPSRTVRRREDESDRADGGGRTLQIGRTQKPAAAQIGSIGAIVYVGEPAYRPRWAAGLSGASMVSRCGGATAPPSHVLNFRSGRLGRTPSPRRREGRESLRCAPSRSTGAHA